MGFIIATICGLVWAFFCVGSIILVHKLNEVNFDRDVLTGFFFFGIFFGFIVFWFILYYWKKQRKEKLSSSGIFPEFDEKPYINSYFENRRKVFEEALKMSESNPKDSMVLEEAYEYFLDAENLSEELNGLLKKSFDLSRQVNY